MPLSLTVDPISRDIAGLISDLSPQAVSAQLVAAARGALAEADAQNQAALGYVPKHTTTVDGAEGASEDNVRPNGTIVYDFAIIDDVFAWIMDALEKAAPVRSGRFEHSFALFADGVEVDPAQVPQASEYVFVNTQPYVRKVERGFSPQAPHGVFEAIATLARQQFGSQQAKISFGYRALTGGAIGAWASTPSARRLAASHRGTGAKHTDWLTQSPAIIVTLK